MADFHDLGDFFGSSRIDDRERDLGGLCGVRGPFGTRVRFAIIVGRGDIFFANDLTEIDPSSL